MAEVLVGKKPVFKYVFAIVEQMKENKKIKVKARGSSITKAVNAVEIVKNRGIVEGLKVKSVKIGTDTLKSEKGDKKVSFIEIELER